MDPKHIIAALCRLYLQERGDYVRISGAFLRNAYQEAKDIKIEILEQQDIVLVYKPEKR